MKINAQHNALSKVIKTTFKIENIYSARRTLELLAELSVSRDCWHKLFPQLCDVIFCDFRHACQRRRIFNMLNNFMHERTFSSQCARALSYQLSNQCECECVFITYFTRSENYDSSLSEDEEVLLNILLLRRRRRCLRAANQKTWVKS